jgi:hypothetical protein
VTRLATPPRPARSATAAAARATHQYVPGDRVWLGSRENDAGLLSRSRGPCHASPSILSGAGDTSPPGAPTAASRCRPGASRSTAVALTPARRLAGRGRADRPAPRASLGGRSTTGDPDTSSTRTVTADLPEAGRGREAGADEGAAESIAATPTTGTGAEAEAEEAVGAGTEGEAAGAGAPSGEAGGRGCSVGEVGAGTAAGAGAGAGAGGGAG